MVRSFVKKDHKSEVEFHMKFTFFTRKGEMHRCASTTRSFRRLKMESSITLVFKFLPTLNQLQGRIKSLKEILPIANVYRCLRNIFYRRALFAFDFLFLQQPESR